MMIFDSLSLASLFGVHAALLLMALFSLLMVLWQLYVLMSLPAQALAGPYDKALWLLILLVVPLGWLLFWIWRWNHKELRVVVSQHEPEESKLSKDEVGAKLLLQEQRLKSLLHGGAPKIH